MSHDRLPVVYEDAVTVVVNFELVCASAVVSKGIVTLETVEVETVTTTADVLVVLADVEGC